MTDVAANGTEKETKQLSPTSLKRLAQQPGSVLSDIYNDLGAQIFSIDDIVPSQHVYAFPKGTKPKHRIFQGILPRHLFNCCDFFTLFVCPVCKLDSVVLTSTVSFVNEL
jgi:hypothetical protein